MRVHYLSILGLALLILLPDVLSQKCPPRCTCKKSNSVNCSAVSTFPRFAKDVENITILDSNMTEITDADVNYLPHLNSLILNDNELSLIKNGTFSGNMALRNVLLGNNKLGVLETGVFCHLESLQRLELQNNRIVRLRPFTFHNLSSLSYLDLSNNALSVIDENSLAEVSNLTHLKLTDNFLTSVPSHIFHFTKNLRFLHLEHNNISALPNYSFSPMKDLRNLYLSGNKFNILEKLAFQLNASHGVSPYDKEVKLRHLEMINCDLYDVPLVLDDLPFLTELDISLNNFTIIKGFSLYNLHRLEFLRIDKIVGLKEIHRGAFAGLENLRMVHLSNCPNLTNIPEKLFTSSINLSALHLGGNSLRSIPENAANWDKLLFLDLQDNRIQCDCKAEWIQKRILSKRWPTVQVSNNVRTINCYDNLGVEKLRDFDFRSLGCGQEISSAHANQLLTGLVAALIAVVTVLILCLAVRYRKKIQSKYRHFKYLRHTDDAPFTINAKYSDLDAKDEKQAPNHVDVYKDEKDDENLI